MLSIHEQLINLQNSHTILSKNGDTKLEIAMFPNMNLFVDISKYPKKPKISIPKQFMKFIGDIESFNPMLREWDQKNPADIGIIIDNVKMTIEALSGVKIRISFSLLQNLFEFANNAFPSEMICVLRLMDGTLKEFVMAPGSVSNSISAIYYPLRIGHDKSLIASCHSHPNGNPFPSVADLESFRLKPINIILGYPWRTSNIGVFNQIGEPVKFEITGIDE